MALKFNVDGRDLGSVVHETMDLVAEKVKVPEGHFLLWADELTDARMNKNVLKIEISRAGAKTGAIL